MRKMNNFLKKLLYGSYLWYFAEGLFAPLYAMFAEGIGGSVLDLTLAYSIYLIVGGLLYITFGKLSDSKHTEKLIIIGYEINTVATFCLILVDSPLKLFIVEAMLGAASAIASPAWSTLYSKNLDEGKIGEEIGYSEGVPWIISGIAVILGGLIVNYIGYKALFLIMGVIQLSSTIIQRRVLRVQNK
ncbi:Multidrug resistance protein MdtG [Candidatus Tiddalikarchaeum anstoanum]|nr:Multidrug resistance protein MdtG [Candidatus Tiddalikarchaeum anstoanum]